MHRCFLFDLDQTLLDFHASERIALKIVLEANGFKCSEDTYEHFKKVNKSLWLELEKGTVTRTELFRTRFEDVFSFCGGRTDDVDPLEVNSEFIRTMSVNGVLMDGALPFISKLKNDVKDSKIYIVSNGATINAQGRIRSTGLDRYIDKLYISESMGVAKPSPEFFEMVLADINEPKDSCIVIGDSLTSDMLGAKNASLTSVWFMPQGDIEASMAQYDIDFTASDYDGLYQVLVSWAGKISN